MLSEKSRAEILDFLRAYAGESRESRGRAIDSLIRHDFTEDEISEALEWETVRLAEERATMEALKRYVRA